MASAGIGAALVAATTTALADTPPAEAGLRSGVVNTFHELGSALGVAVLSSLAAPSLTDDASVSSRVVLRRPLSDSRVTSGGSDARMRGSLRAFQAAP